MEKTRAQQGERSMKIFDLTVMGGGGRKKFPWTKRESGILFDADKAGGGWLSTKKSGERVIRAKRGMTDWDRSFKRGNCSVKL